MAFLTGFANLTLYTKFRSFATMVTGNTMWMALAATESRPLDVAYYISVIGSYLVGTCIFRNINLSPKHKTNLLPLSAGIITALFGLGDWIHYHGPSVLPFLFVPTTTALSTSISISSLPRWIPMMLFATAFGVTNQVGQEVSGTLTFVITGHLTRLSHILVDQWGYITYSMRRRFHRFLLLLLLLLRMGPKQQRQGRQVGPPLVTATPKKMTQVEHLAMIQNAAVPLGFAAGATLGCILLGRQWLHHYGIISMIGLSYASVWLAHDLETIGGAWWLRYDKHRCDQVVDDGKICDLEEEEEEVEAATVAFEPSDDKDEVPIMTTSTITTPPSPPP
jgi:hypothetical protein